MKPEQNPNRSESRVIALSCLTWIHPSAAAASDLPRPPREQWRRRGDRSADRSASWKSSVSVCHRAVAPVVHTQGMSPSFTAQHHFTTLSDSRCIYHTAPAPDRMTLIRRVSAPDTVFRQQSFTTVAQLIGLIITFNLLPVSFCVVWFHKSLSLGCFTSGTKRTQRKSRKVVSSSPSGPSIIQRFFFCFLEANVCCWKNHKRRKSRLEGEKSARWIRVKLIRPREVFLFLFVCFV